MLVPPKYFYLRAIGRSSRANRGFEQTLSARWKSAETSSAIPLAMWLTPLLLAGCANPGPPKPPSLHLPRPAENLAAVRTGDQVVLTWTTPNETTDGGKLQMPVTAVICRDDAPKSPPSTPKYPTPPDPCKPVRRLAVTPGSSSAVDLLSDSLTVGPPSLISYRIELQNPRGRSAGQSAPVYAAKGAAPPPMGTITVSARRNATLIAWQPRDSPSNLPPAPVEVERTLIATAAGPVEPAQPKSAKREKTAISNKSAPRNAAARATLQQATLRLDGPAAQARTDPGGLVDRSIHDGDTLTYIAQRVRSVELTTPEATYASKDGKPRQSKPVTQSFEVRGERSPAVTFTFHDVAPPAPPTGLAAVPGGGFGEPPSVDLSWDPNPELDILGYSVFRAEGDGKPVRLNPEAVPGPAYRDLTAQPGHKYRYFVTAVDQRHNESAASMPVIVMMHK
jgi:hypothetical protein